MLRTRIITFTLTTLFFFESNAQVFILDEMVFEQEGSIAKRLEAFPKNADNHFDYGHFLVANERFSEAEPYLLKALELNPHHEMAKNYRVVARYRSGNYEAAQEVFEEYYGKQKNLMALHLQMGIHMNSSNFTHLAPAAFERALEIEPDNAEVYAEYGLALINAGNDNAIEKFERALELEPTDAQTYSAYALFYALENEWQKAEEIILRGINNVENNAWLFKRWADVSKTKLGGPDPGTKEYEKIDNIFRTGLSKYPSSLELIRGYKIFRFQKEDDIILGYLKNVHENDSNNVEVIMELASHLSNYEDYSRAKDYYLQALSMEKNNTTYRQEYLAFLFSVGEYKDLVEVADYYLENDYIQSEFDYHLSRYLVGATAENNARAVFEKLLKVRPDHQDIMLNYGVFLLESGEIDSAEEFIRDLLERSEYVYMGEQLYNEILQKKSKVKELNQ